jgi:hypothetical protein
MQYILTEEEYNKLRWDREYTIGLKKEILQDLCTEIADTMPVKRPYDAPEEEPRPWGCLLTMQKKGQEYYCDLCPVQKICPHDDKEWSQ